jgi:hypothetical protein
MRERLKAAGSASPAYNALTREHMKNSLTLSADDVQERLARGDEHVIRLKVPRHQEVRFEDIIRGWVVVQSANIDDKVLFKSDGMPTYHLANIVDDHLMRITHVIRGRGVAAQRAAARAALRGLRLGAPGLRPPAADPEARWQWQAQQARWRPPRFPGFPAELAGPHQRRKEQRLPRARLLPRGLHQHAGPAGLEPRGRHGADEHGRAR